ncbi:uncharacterized protein LOC144152175 [Haemaphysalis longicornis]
MKRACFLLLLAGVFKEAFVCSAGPIELIQDALDSFKMMQIFKSIVSISNTSNGTEFLCSRAYRISILPFTRRSEYIWMLPTPGDPTPQPFLFHEKAEDGGKVLLTVNNDPTVFVGTFLYSDNKNCIVEDLDFNGHYCVLWIQEALRRSVPQHCIDKFVEFCGVQVPEHTTDLCPHSVG